MSIEYKIIFLYKAHNMEPRTIAMLLDAEIKLLNPRLSPQNKTTITPLAFISMVIAVELDQHTQLQNADANKFSEYNYKKHLRPRMLLRDMNNLRTNNNIRKYGDAGVAAGHIRQVTGTSFL